MARKVCFYGSLAFSAASTVTGVGLMLTHYLLWAKVACYAGIASALVFGILLATGKEILNG